MPLRVMGRRRIAPLLLILPLHAVAALPLAAQDESLDRMLARVNRDASSLWDAAPAFMAKETWREKSTKPGRAKHRFGIQADSDAPPENAPPPLTTREVVSYYALAPYRHAPESLWEFRKIIAVDGKPLGDPETLRADFLAGLRGVDDQWRRKLRKSFEAQDMAGVMVDFGQLLLLFSKPRLSEYRFSLSGAERVGADTALRIHFGQQQGKQALKIRDPGKHVAAPLEGEILVRDYDYSVLEIRLRATRQEKKFKIVDEAQVDYSRTAAGAPLPASVVHRRFLNQRFEYEDSFQYSAWEEIGGTAASR